MRMPIESFLQTAMGKQEENRDALTLAGFKVGVTQPGQRRQRQDRPLAPSAGGIRVRITIISVRHKLLDGDNLVGGSSLKGLQDLIAAKLGVPDGDRRLAWEYQQIQSFGSEGTIIKLDIEP